MIKKTIYGYAIILAILIAFTNCQFCNDTALPIMISNVDSTDPNLYLTWQGNAAVGVWLTPSVTSSLLTVKGWTSTNGSLVQLILVGDSRLFNATIPAGRDGTIRGQYVQNGTVILSFAQKDNAHNNMLVEVFSKSSNQPASFTALLLQRQYSTQQNGTCVQTCPEGKGIKFYKDANGTQDILHFVCWQKNNSVWIMGLIIMMILGMTIIA